VEYPIHDPEAKRRITQPVAVSYIKTLAQNIQFLSFLVNNNAHFLLDIAKQPKIVVACEPVHRNAGIGKFGQLAKKTNKTLRHNLFVFVPEVYHIAQHIQGSAIGLNAIEPADQFFFVPGHRYVGAQTQMSIGYKVYFSPGTHTIKDNPIRAWPLRTSCLCSIPARKPD